MNSLNTEKKGRCPLCKSDSSFKIVNTIFEEQEDHYLEICDNCGKYIIGGIKRDTIDQYMPYLKRFSKLTKETNLKGKRLIINIISLPDLISENNNIDDIIKKYPDYFVKDN